MHGIRVLINAYALYFLEPSQEKLNLKLTIKQIILFVFQMTCTSSTSTWLLASQ
jgi:hypothetical protein